MSLTATPPDVVAAVPQRSSADRLMRRILRLPVDADPGTAEGARKAFQTSMLVATVRCLLMYIVFPFVLPALGIAKGVGPAIGLAVNLVAMVCIVFSLRRFFRADHPKRWWYAALGGSVLVLLVVLAATDIADLVR
ncbi:MAG: hypothetical protein K0S92_198 [Desertimonas sp.]|jgi:hypothetical protein|nr:hypothetical protein [Desertimonas sp.]